MEIECPTCHVEVECAAWSWSVLYGGEVCCVEVEYTMLRWSVPCGDWKLGWRWSVLYVG